MPWFKIVAIATTLLLLLIAGFYANEARKEIYYLCGNYHVGDTYSSVVTQLATIHHSVYQMQHVSGGKRIVHHSQYDLYLSGCNIEFDKENKVRATAYHAL